MISSFVCLTTNFDLIRNQDFFPLSFFSFFKSRRFPFYVHKSPQIKWSSFPSHEVRNELELSRAEKSSN